MLIMKSILTACVIGACCLLFSRCNDKISVDRQVDFTLECWHLQSTIRQGEQVELRLTLKQTSDFEGTEYYIGYIQLSGKGEVYDRDGTLLVNRELHELTSIAELDRRDPNNQQFTLFYKSLSSKNTELQIIVADNFGEQKTLDISFANDSESND